MDTVYVLLTLSLIYYRINYISSFCLSGCSCTNDGLGRALLCMEAALRRIPENVPQDFIKIRIENSHLIELPRGAFLRVSALRFLWLNFNEITVLNVRSLEGLKNLTELRLQGNKLSSVPWTAFQDTPNLKILDLKHNRLDVLPENALRHLVSLSYLDLSFNKLTVISRDVILNWPLYGRSEKHGYREEGSANVFLALHENPWLCDCRLKGFVEFIRTVNPPIILMSSYLSCAAPAFRAGKFFHEVQLKPCMKPVATVPVSNFTRPVGFNVTLTCIATGRPDPVIQWTYGLKIIQGFTESQVQVEEGTVKSELVIHSLHLGDGGIYTCTASNFIGNASAGILVNVQPLNISSLVSPGLPLASAEESAYVDIRIAKQTVYGITLEWHAVTENPAEAWYTIHFGRLDDARKETVYVGPGISSYSVGDLLPITKYEVCVTLKNQAPRSGQCIVFMTGSDVTELEQRGRLVHIVVVVVAMAIAVPAGMYVCGAEAGPRCCIACCSELCRRRWSWRHAEKGPKTGDRQATFHSLQAASDEGLCASSDHNQGTGGKPVDKTPKVKGDHRSTAELY